MRLRCKTECTLELLASQNSAKGFREARFIWKENMALNPCLPAKLKTVHIYIYTHISVYIYIYFFYLYTYT